MSERAVILVVDDSDNDCKLLQRAFLKARVLNPLVILKTGEEAIAYLDGNAKYADRSAYPLPALVLLDIKMPGMDGLEVLRWIRARPHFARLRVVGLTSSKDMPGVSEASQLGANSFLVKPVNFERFGEIAHALSGCWFWVDKPPHAHREMFGPPRI